MKYFSFVLLASVLFFNSSLLNAQSACCGLDFMAGMLLESGVYGGYGAQQFSATGLNGIVKTFNQQNTVTSKMDEFGFAHGWRVGANLLNVQDENMLYGLHIFYQQTQEKNEATITSTNGIPAKREYALTLISYGFGISFSYVLNNSFDFKIADIKMSWNNAKLLNKYTYVKKR